jgi:hypothetical protein
LRKSGAFTAELSLTFVILYVADPFFGRLQLRVRRTAQGKECIAWASLEAFAGVLNLCCERKKVKVKKLPAIALLIPVVAGAQIQKLSCSSSSITGAASDACTVALSFPASNGFTVTLSSSNSAVTVPSQVSATSGARSLGFTATAAAVTSAQTATLTASYRFAGRTSSQTFSLNLYPAPTSGSTLTVTPTSLAFGTVALNTPATLPVTLKNTGNSSITGTAMVSGTGFSMTAASGTISPGQSITGTVQFDPSSAGAATGTLTVKTNAENPLITVPLTGTGGSASQHSVTLNWSAPSNSPDPISGYITYRSANGAAYAALNSSPLSATTYTDKSVQSGVTYNYYVESQASNGSLSTPSNAVQVKVP